MKNCVKVERNIIDKIFDVSIGDIPIFVWAIAFPFALMIFIVKTISENKYIQKMWDKIIHLFIK